MMKKKISDNERKVLVSKYTKLGLSEKEAEKKVSSHVKVMLISPLLMALF